MTEEEQMYIEADNYLKALSEHKSQEEAEKVFSSFDMKEAIIGLLEKEGLITNNYGDIITQYGKTVLTAGGLHQRYLRKRCMRILTWISAIGSLIAAIVGVILLFKNN